MRLSARLAAVTFGVMFAATHASACKFGGNHGVTAWDTAEKEAQDNEAIFEGRVERFEVQWDILRAKPGNMVSAELRDSKGRSDNAPYMLITFRVSRAYKGNLGPEVQVRTGMGGGDCAAQYATGLDYLVYAFGRSPSELAVSMCSPGGWLGSNYHATELRYLRKERPLPGDLTRLEYWTHSAVLRRDREQEEFVKRSAAATGQICGTVIRPVVDGVTNRVDFLPVAGSSPYQRSSAEVDREGRFCSERLGPGRYYLSCTRERWFRELEFATYYPGVADREKAAILDVSAGQVRPNLVFKVPRPRTYTVRAFLSTDEKPGVGENGAFAALVGLDSKVWRYQNVDFRGSFPLPKVKYLTFDNVPPGRYIACVFASGQGWLTRIVDVNVTTHDKLIWLELKHGRPK